MLMLSVSWELLAAAPEFDVGTRGRCNHRVYSGAQPVRRRRSWYPSLAKLASEGYLVQGSVLWRAGFVSPRLPHDSRPPHQQEDAENDEEDAEDDLN